MKHLSFSEISSFLDGELDEREKKKIEDHLILCDKCKKTFNLLKEIDSVIVEGAPQWVNDNFLDSLNLTEKKEKRFGFSVKKLALGMVAFLILTLPVIGILRTSYEEKINKEFQILIEEHETMGIEGVAPIKW
ncbi:MAG TPA: zf-HC2 domain-containing protein [Candidatus Atribacteria bacterium]|nr:zf-HC2 domain-containing protein [Candidatus Atribacteria bacterium]